MTTQKNIRMASATKQSKAKKPKKPSQAAQLDPDHLSFVSEALLSLTSIRFKHVGDQVRIKAPNYYRWRIEQNGIADSKVDDLLKLMGWGNGQLLPEIVHVWCTKADMSDFETIMKRLRRANITAFIHPAIPEPPTITFFGALIRIQLEPRSEEIWILMDKHWRYNDWPARCDSKKFADLVAKSMRRALPRSATVSVLDDQPIVARMDQRSLYWNGGKTRTVLLSKSEFNPFQGAGGNLTPQEPQAEADERHELRSALAEMTHRLRHVLREYAKLQQLAGNGKGVKSKPAKAGKDKAEPTQQAVEELRPRDTNLISRAKALIAEAEILVPEE